MQEVAIHKAQELPPDARQAIDDCRLMIADCKTASRRLPFNRQPSISNRQWKGGRARPAFGLTIVDG